MAISAFHQHPVAFLQIGDAAGERGERQRVGAKIGLALLIAFAATHHQRRSEPGADHQIVMIAKQDGQREGPFQPGQHGLDRFMRRLARLHLFGDQMNHHFGVGLAFESAPARFQFTAQRFEILDNAIVHHRDRAAGVRMGIVHRRRAMGGPAGMRDAGGPGSRLSHQLFGQILQLALGPAAIEPAIMHGTDAGGIIAAIFQPLQPFDQPIGHIAAP